jgi:long-chain acyl-CoA synthetase
VADVLDLAATHGDRDFLIQGDLRLSFAAHDLAVRRIADELRTRGVQPGDRVGLYGANSATWVASFFAIAGLGAIVVLCNAWWSPEQLRHAREETEPVLLLADTASLDKVPTGQPVLALAELEPALRATDANAPSPLAYCHEDTPAAIMYTSGTTGAPKGAVLSHRALIANLQGLLHVSGRLPGSGPPPRRTTGVVGLPIFHIGGLQLLLVSLTNGNTIVFLSGRFDPAEVLRLIESEAATVLSAVPTMIMRVVHHPDLARTDTTTLRTVVMGGAPVTREMLDRVNAAFPTAQGRVGQSYGMTELGGVVSTGVGADLEAHPGSAGRLMPIAEVRIENPDPTGAGELLVRTPAAMDGYWGRPNDPILTADGWVRTGDLGRVDDEGFLYITGRAKDLIIRGGENIAAAHVEARLGEHPAVHEVAVVGLPHPDLGEEVGAVVVVSEDAVVTAAELAAHAREGLSYFEVPSRWWIRTTPLQHNDAGKLLKRVLRDEWPPEPEPAGHTPTDDGPRTS